MGLNIVHDGSEQDDVLERCCMCRKPTSWWWGIGAQNVALCPECAKTTKDTELPTKDEWIAKERKLSPAIGFSWFP